MRQINLLPEEIQNAERTRLIRNSVILIFTPVLGGCLLIHVLLGLWSNSLERRVKQPLALGENVETSQLKHQIDAQKQTAEAFLEANREIVETFVRQASTSNVLKVISELTKNKVWLTGISFDAEKRICQLDGRSFNTRLVSEFMLDLKSLPYLENVELISMGKGTTSVTGEIDFKIVCNLK